MHKGGGKRFLRHWRLEGAGEHSMCRPGLAQKAWTDDARRDMSFKCASKAALTYQAFFEIARASRQELSASLGGDRERRASGQLQLRRRSTMMGRPLTKDEGSSKFPRLLFYVMDLFGRFPDLAECHKFPFSFTATLSGQHCALNVMSWSPCAIFHDIAAGGMLLFVRGRRPSTRKYERWRSAHQMLPLEFSEPLLARRSCLRRPLSTTTDTRTRVDPPTRSGLLALHDAGRIS